MKHSQAKKLSELTREAGLPGTLKWRGTSDAPGIRYTCRIPVAYMSYEVEYFPEDGGSWRSVFRINKGPLQMVDWGLESREEAQVICHAHLHKIATEIDKFLGIERKAR